MATRSLSPKQILEKTQQHRQAVMMVALMRAKKAINAKLKAQGVRLTLVLPAVINAQARDYFAQHRDELIAEALLRLCKYQVRNDRGICASVD